MKLPNLKNLLAGGASGLIDSAKGIIDELTLSKEEKAKINLELEKAINDHSEKMAEIALKETEAHIADMADARNREIQIATSKDVPLLNKIIQPVLAILLLGSCFIFWYIILFKDIPTEKEMIIAGITGSLTTVATGVVSYYFGSSVGSKANGDTLRKIVDKG